MAFVDGENLTFRGQAVATEGQITLAEGDSFRRDCFVWIPDVRPETLVEHVGWYQGAYGIQVPTFIRASYYTSVSGDEPLIKDVKEKLRTIGFDPYVFKKTKQELKAKGVDIAMSKDMLSHAFLGNYDVAFLFAGDGDYIPLVEEVKRLGKQVFLFFYRTGLSDPLRLTCDKFVDITDTFLHKWKKATGG